MTSRVVRACGHRYPDGRPCGRATTHGNRCDNHPAPARNASFHRRGYDREYTRNRTLLLSNARTCSGCGGEPTPPNHLTIDHVIPIAAGGSNELSNLRVLCRDCNSKLGQQFGDGGVA